MTMQWEKLDLTLSGLREHYRAGDFSPTDLLQHLNEMIDAYEAAHDNCVWLYRLQADELEPYLDQLANLDPEQAPLWGVPFAIKDNIDLAGVPTTAACPAFAYEAQESAMVVQRLLAAGALPLGKTNLDQFATGLVGVRSPYGVCRNALNEDYISGGSSSGSAVAVAKHWVSFALGTDTAGSGRVPAALNNLVGLKPSKGLLSTRGVVPACRSLDCVSLLTLNVDDANAVFDVAASFDAKDAYARPNPYANGPRYYRATEQAPAVGVPRAEQLKFFGDPEAQALFSQALTRLREDGATVVEVDFQPFIDAALLLYQGPWVAERYLAAKSIYEQDRAALLPVIDKIIGAGAGARATDAFSAQYQLMEYAKHAHAVWQEVDVVVTPTNGTAYTVAEVLAEPLALNSNLGYYTNFMNLLDCAAVALTHGFKDSGIGCGLTLFAPAFNDKKLLGIAARWQNCFALAPGTCGRFKPQGQSVLPAAGSFVDVVVCGAHLQGLPLNWQLTERGARLLARTQSSARYRMYALPGGPPRRPAMVRVSSGGVALEVEVWRLPSANFGSFVSEIPAPLGIGKVELADGRWLPGFICEGNAIEAADNISGYGGWRNYLAQGKP